MSLCFFKRYFAKRYALLQALKAGALDSEQQQVNFGARFFAHLAKVLIVACFSPCFFCKIRVLCCNSHHPSSIIFPAPSFFSFHSQKISASNVISRLAMTTSKTSTSKTTAAAAPTKPTADATTCHHASRVV
jgi:hypothetical protein